jgi:hypothetical protein
MRTTTALVIAGLCGLQAGSARAADDDLTVVKRAVQGADAPPRPAASRGGARWFRVRVEERGGGKIRVNLPLPFVRALGEKADTWPDGFHCGRKGAHCTVKLSDVLGALDAGQEFVTIDDQEASVRIWID